METEQLWQKYMRGYDFLCNVGSYRQNLEDVVRACGPRGGMRVLDAGSGTGNLSLILKSMGAEVVSLDFSGEALARHRAKDPNAQQIQASLEVPLALSEESCDAVCCASVLFALSKAGCKLALGEFYRVLRKGGRLIVTVAAPEKRARGLFGMHVRNCISRHGRWGGFVRGMRDIPSITRIVYYNALLQKLPDWKGYHRFQESELHEFLSMAGFEGVKVERTYGGCFFLVEAQKPAAKSEGNTPVQLDALPQNEMRAKISA